MITPFRQLLKSHGLTIREFANKFDIPTRTVENWSRGANPISDYQFNLFRFALEHGYKKPAYFCGADNCGRTFDSVETDLHCPFCGSCEVYPNTEEGKLQSIRAMTAYEDSLIEWE